jgi:hypothetical protein
MCIIGDLRKNKTKVGCYSKAENVKCVKANNFPPKRSPCCVPNSNKMTMRSMCQETCEN